MKLYIAGNKTFLVSIIFISSLKTNTPTTKISPAKIHSFFWLTDSYSRKGWSFQSLFDCETFNKYQLKIYSWKLCLFSLGISTGVICTPANPAVRGVVVVVQKLGGRTGSWKEKKKERKENCIEDARIFFPSALNSLFLYFLSNIIWIILTENKCKCHRFIFNIGPISSQVIIY